MASEPGAPTLDQLTIFLTIVDTGSFAAAARTLNRANSVISYAIANLEAQLGFPLFDRESTRKPQLTAAGRSILAEARTVSDGIAGLRAKARGLIRGLEPEVHLVVDVMLPTERLVDALTAFRDEFPTVALRLRVEALGAVTQLVLDDVAGIGISGPMPGFAAHPAIEPIRVGEVELVAVAAPKHPLAKAGGRSMIARSLMVLVGALVAAVGIAPVSADCCGPVAAGPRSARSIANPMNFRRRTRPLPIGTRPSDRQLSTLEAGMSELGRHSRDFWPVPQMSAHPLTAAEEQTSPICCLGPTTDIFDSAALRLNYFTKNHSFHVGKEAVALRQLQQVLPLRSVR
jgi:Bacterial regulatory helix-turn-helix protein, lysR family/LysR substrate binding domain